MLIKICGITNIEDALCAKENGADLLGFIFYSKSPRYIMPQFAKEIIAKVKKCNKPLCVGVFVNESFYTIEKIVNECGLDIVQLHGNESIEFCKELREKLGVKVMKVFKIKDESSLNELNNFKNIANYFLCDTYSPNKEGGTGETFNYDHIKNYLKDNKIILAGGLNPDNISEILKLVKPYGVDVSSGVELSAGKKDHQKIKDFIRIVRENEM